jgi:hypothetical protein
MVRVGFVVEGHCEKMLLESSHFRYWAGQHSIDICDPIINARGGSNLCTKKIDASITECRVLANPDKIVVLTDLECDPCMTAVKERIGEKGVAQIVVAKKALEAWFLADTVAMRSWLENDNFQGELTPEETPDMPWERLKEIGRNYHKNQRGPGSRKKRFAGKMINTYRFSIERAANHPQCPSAKYFLEKLQKL